MSEFVLHSIEIPIYIQKDGINQRIFKNILGNKLEDILKISYDSQHSPSNWSI